MLEGEEVISSQLFLIEVSNAFWKYHKAGLLDEKTVCANIEKAIAIVDEFCDLDKTQCCEATKEAMRLRHPVYDMLYFVLARRNAATLFTLDRKLQPPPALAAPASPRPARAHRPRRRAWRRG